MSTVIFHTNGNERQKDCARAWLDDSVSEILYGGSKGSAKSYTGCSLIFGDAFLYPETRYFIARKKLNDLRKHTISSIFEVFKHWKISPTAYKYNGQDSVFKLNNGSEVFLLDAAYMPSDPMFERFGSIQMTRGWIEEAGEFNEDAKLNLQASIGRWKNDVYNLKGKLLMTCNPSKNFLYRLYKENKAGTLDSRIRFIQALPQDNKKLPEGYLDNLNRILSGAQKQRLLFGNWEYDDSPNALIPYERILDLFTNKQAQNITGKHYITADVARKGSDKAVIIVWRDYEVIEIVEYDKCSLTTLQNTITALKMKYKVPHSNIIADEDGVGGGVVDNLNISGFTNNAAAIKIKGKTENYQNLKTQCYYKYADMVNDGEVYISYECGNKQKETIIEEHEQIQSYKPDIEQKLRILPKEIVKENIGHSPDYTDAMAMRIWFDIKPKPVVIGYSNW